MSKRSYLIAYILYLTSAPFGLHLLYVSRPNQALVWALTFGGFGFGILRDVFALPRYVREANFQNERMEQSQLGLGHIPPWSILRVSLQFFVGIYFGIVLSFLVPSPPDGEVISHKDIIISNILFALGLSCGVKLAGSIGNEHVDFLQPFLCSLLVALVISCNHIGLLKLEIEEEEILNDILVLTEVTMVLYGSVRSRRYNRICGEVKLKEKNKNYWAVTSTLRHFFYIWVFSVLLSIGLYNHGIVSVKGSNNSSSENVRVPLHTLFADVPFEEIWEGLKRMNPEDWRRELELYSRRKGIQHAFKVLELNMDATPQQVKKKFRELSVKYHPDRNRGESPEKQKSLEENYIKITQAYETVKVYQND